MPACAKCGVEKPADQFYASDRSCKDCRRAMVRANRKANAKYYRAYDHIRAIRPERKQMFLEKTRRLRARGLGRAHSAVANAVRKGRLVRPDRCQRCNSTGDIEAHHDDHNRLLDVMWLCPVCHAARHLEIGHTPVNTTSHHPTPF